PAGQRQAILRLAESAAPCLSSCAWSNWPPPSFCRLQVNRPVLQHKLLEDLARLNAVQADVGVYRGLQLAMPQQPPHQFVLARPAHKDDRARRMTELVSGHAQPGFLIDTLGDLPAQADLALGTAELPREQRIIIAAAQQSRPEVVDIFVDDGGGVLVQR